MKLTVDQALRKAATLAKTGDKTGADAIYRDVLARFPGNHKAAAGLQGLSTSPRGNPAQAELTALVALYRQRRFADAAASAAQLLKGYPGSEILHNLAGVFDTALGRHDDAIAHFDRALALAPDFADAHNNRGNALIGRSDFTAALAAFDAAICLKRDYVDAHVNRAVALGKFGRVDDALTALATAIRFDPMRAQAYNNRGNILLGQHRLADALADYDKAIELRPAYAEALVNRGNVLKMLKREADALASYDAAIAASPRLAKAHNNRGIALRALKRPEDALAAHETALRLDPRHARAYGEILNLRAHMCRWPDAPRDDALLGGGEPISPFYMLHLVDDPQRHLATAKAWAEEKFGGIVPASFGPRAPGAKIRVGYFSADFHNHATMYLMARLFELHDSSRFEIHAFSYGAKAQDAMRARLLAAVHAFHDVRTLDDGAVATLARTHAIDIAVDLKGYTEDGRPGIFAHRAAPVQVSYLGYPGTLGAGFMDYVLTDAITIPHAKRADYTEQVLHLPHSYQVNDDRREIAADPVSRADVGLPEDGFVFCCFNNNYKIAPDVFAIWMRLLAATPGSVLWLLQDSEIAAANLRAEAHKHGIDAARLIFAARAPLPVHLARHRCADLFLDTFNYNAHTTASDALWMGLPVVTRSGRSFAARVGASLLAALELPELVTETAENYEALALRLARDLGSLAAIKAKLARNRDAGPLFDTARFARDIEAIYQSLQNPTGAR